MEIKILYVEDSYPDVLMMRRILEVDGRNFSLKDVSNGDEALNILERESFDFILIDYNLSGMNSLDLLKEINRRFKKLPVMILSNYREEEIATSYLKNGAIGFISKDEILDGSILNQIVEAIFIKEEAKEEFLRERKVPLKALFERGTENIYKSLIENMSEGIIALDPKKKIIFVNKRICEMLTCKEKEILGINILEIIDKRDRDAFNEKMSLVEKGEKCYYEIRLSHNKKKVAVSLNHVPFFDNDNKINGSFATVTNISIIKKISSESKKKTAELIKAATTDSLTGVLNYTQFLNLLHIEFERAKRYFTDLSCLIIDMDNFKRVNQEYGFSFGDKVLREVANSIVSSCRKSDIIARFGGEKFVILLPNTSYQHALIVAEKLRRKIELHTFTDKNISTKLTFSVGVTSLMEDGVLNPTQLIENAQEAVRVAKEEEKNKVLLFRDIIVASTRVNIKEAEFVNLREKISDITDSTRESYIESLRALIVALEARDPYTKEHSVNVSKYSYLVAKEMNLSSKQAELIKTAGLLHDIGKIGISDAILQKREALTEEETKIIKMHPIYGVNIIHPIKFLTEEQPIVLYHHERIDGKGYPEGISGRRIPIGARILNAVDSFDAMISPRSYRGPLTPRDAVVELIKCSGTQFDPEVVYNLIVILIREKIIPDIFKEERRLYEEIMLKCHKYNLHH
jgi:diguanylate cyclase (GGDEF)-like protein/PAS domain S-box-containing protein/putative nucleotidyltransferase with HDIG domain